MFFTILTQTGSSEKGILQDLYVMLSTSHQPVTLFTKKRVQMWKEKLIDLSQKKMCTELSHAFIYFLFLPLPSLILCPSA